jgi:formiminotetrahydrofolate cyclodeaminase
MHFCFVSVALERRPLALRVLSTTDIIPAMNTSDLPDRLCGRTVDALLADIASGTPAPGGGAASALAGALASALSEMVAGLTLDRSRYQVFEGEMRQLLEQASALRGRLANFVDEDTAAYLDVTASYRLPKNTDEQCAQRSAAIRVALRRATEVPLAVAYACADVLGLAAQAAKHGNRNASTDAAVAALLAHAGMQGAVRNVRVNLHSLGDEAFRAQTDDRVADLLTRGEAFLAEALAASDMGD